MDGWISTRRAAARLALAAVAVMAVGMGWAGAAQAETLTYRVLKEDEPIGSEIVTVQKEGTRTEVTVVTETRVKVLFLDFHYQHHRQENWVDGRLEHVVADTDDDGDKHHLEVRLDGGRLAVVADGQPRQLPDDALPLTLWNQAVLKPVTLYSVIDAAPYAVKVEALGSQPVSVTGKTIEAQHYRMSGGVDRELWYGPDGLLIKTTFQRRGYPITFVRE